MMEEKKYPTSKVIAVSVWIFPTILLGLAAWAVLNEKSLTTVAALATMFVAAFGACAYIVKCYTKKSTIENLMIGYVRYIKCMLALQRDNSDLEIYSLVQLKSDVKYVSDVYKQEIQNNIRTTIQEDVTNKTF